MTIRSMQRKTTKMILLASALLVVMLGASGLVAPKIASAAAANGPRNFDQCVHNFFGLRPWYYYMNNEFHYQRSVSNHLNHPNAAAPCDIKCFNVFRIPASQPKNDCDYRSSDVPGVLLVIIDDLLRIAGFVSTIFVIVGAFQYVTSQGNPEQTARARSTLINSFAGLGVALVAVGFIDFVLSKLIH